ncbi:MAG: BMC domain-containing protein [Candidatus Adiutrix sp.]
MQTRQALGLIETVGYIPLVAAVDGAIKAASVTLGSFTIVGGALVTATVKGDVGSVKAAMDVAQATINALGAAGVTHVIPRPSQSVLGLLGPSCGSSSSKGLSQAKGAPPQPKGCEGESSPPSLAPYDSPSSLPCAAQPNLPVIRAESLVPAIATGPKSPPLKPAPGGAKNTSGGTSPKIGGKAKKPRKK